jgi:hypothetical protein
MGRVPFGSKAVPWNRFGTQNRREIEISGGRYYPIGDEEAPLPEPPDEWEYETEWPWGEGYDE